MPVTQSIGITHGTTSLLTVIGASGNFDAILVYLSLRGSAND